jgi:hypothetical protein
MLDTHNIDIGYRTKIHV